MEAQTNKFVFAFTFNANWHSISCSVTANQNSILAWKRKGACRSFIYCPLEQTASLFTLQDLVLNFDLLLRRVFLFFWFCLAVHIIFWMWPISDSSVDWTRSWTDSHAQKNNNASRDITYTVIQQWTWKLLKSMFTVYRWWWWKPVNLCADYNEHEAQESQNFNYGYLWNNGGNFGVEVFVDAESKLEVVGSQHKWLHRKRSHPTYHCGQTLWVM